MAPAPISGAHATPAGYYPTIASWQRGIAATRLFPLLEEKFVDTHQIDSSNAAPWNFFRTVDCRFG